jgi:hypothetical protein
MLFLRKTLPILLVAFLLSVAVRLPQLGRPLSKHHEFCTAVTLRVLQVWWDNGIEKYRYNPVMTYNNEADKFINNFANATGKVVDEEGNFYYVSHPPFAYYFPYIVFKTDSYSTRCSFAPNLQLLLAFSFRTICVLHCLFVEF